MILWLYCFSIIVNLHNICKKQYLLKDYIQSGIHDVFMLPIIVFPTVNSDNKPSAEEINSIQIPSSESGPPKSNSNPISQLQICLFVSVVRKETKYLKIVKFVYWLCWSSLLLSNLSWFGISIIYKEQAERVNRNTPLNYRQIYFELTSIDIFSHKFPKKQLILKTFT